MKRLITILIIVMALAEIIKAQNINWKSLREDQRNIIQLNFGYDFGTVAQISYNHSFELFKPILLGLDFSIPMGRDVFDDFKISYGGQMEVLEYGDFLLTIKVISNFRRYQTELVRIVSFGSDFAAVVGYYMLTWHVAGEFGFDKSINSYLKHSDVMKSIYPDIKDGWYIPSGGHFYYGIQASKTLNDLIEVALRFGATRAQKNDEEAVLPAYFQLGFVMKI